MPEYEGLRIDPCIPARWPGFSIKRTFRGKSFDIEVLNKNGVQKNVKSLTLNGKQLDGNFIPIELAEDNNSVVVEMG
jgi:cellobiose phosphorylase